MKRPSVRTAEGEDLVCIWSITWRRRCKQIEAPGIAYAMVLSIVSAGRNVPRGTPGRRGY